MFGIEKLAEKVDSLASWVSGVDSRVNRLEF